jgi:hypothetical protein
MPWKKYQGRNYTPNVTLRRDRKLISWFVRLECAFQILIMLRTSLERNSFLINTHSENKSLLGCYAMSSGKWLWTFRRIILRTPSGSNSSSPLFLDCWTLQLKAQQYFETSVTIYQSTPRNIPEDLNFRQRENLRFRPLLLHSIQIFTEWKYCIEEKTVL